MNHAKTWVTKHLKSWRRSLFPLEGWTISKQASVPGAEWVMERVVKNIRLHWPLKDYGFYFGWDEKLLERVLFREVTYLGIFARVTLIDNFVNLTKRKSVLTNVERIFKNTWSHNAVFLLKTRNIMVFFSEYNLWFAHMNCSAPYAESLHSAICIHVIFTIFWGYFESSFSIWRTSEQKFPKVTVYRITNEYKQFSDLENMSPDLLAFLASLLPIMQYCLPITLSYSMFKDRKPQHV